MSNSSRNINQKRDKPHPFSWQLGQASNSESKKFMVLGLPYSTH
jgi:hypothetical protein